jgi:hypothetical protein
MANQSIHKFEHFLKELEKKCFNHQHPFAASYERG